jgi:hypothetical protein
MKKILLGCSVFALLLYAPSYTYAQTCDPKVNVPSYEVNKPAPIVCDTHGSQHVKIVDTDGNIISLIPVATAAAPSYNEGAKVPLSSDLAGNARTTLGTLLAGEDQTNGVMKVEERYSYALDDADLVVKGTPGFVHTFTCWGEDGTAEAGSVTLRDATSAGSGTIVYGETFAAAAYTAKTIILDAIFATGIVIDFTTTTDVFCTVTYR